jgi:integrase
VTKIRLQFVQAFVDRHGKARFYFRRGSTRIPLPGLPGSDTFMAGYQAALNATPTPVGASLRSKPGSVSAAIAAYFDSGSFRTLGAGTQVSRRVVLERFRDQHGDKPLSSMPSEFLHLLLDRMTPHQGRNFLKAFRHVIKWCRDRKLLNTDPTLGIKVRLPRSDGYHCWDESEIAAFEAHWPIGSKARLALALGLFTALRRSDCVRIGKQHVRDGVLTVRPEKTKNTTAIRLTIPIHPELQKIIAATSVGHLTLLTTKSGKPYDADAFSVQFRTWCDAAGVPGSFHGLRKAACRRLAEAGCSASEIAAVSGHATLAEVSRYTKAADQAKLARAALGRIANESVKPEPTQVSNPLIGQSKKAG